MDADARTDLHGNANGLSIERIVGVVDQDIDWEHIDRNVSRTRNTRNGVVSQTRETKP